LNQTTLSSPAQVDVLPGAGGVAAEMPVPMQALAAMAPDDIAHLAAHSQRDAAAEATPMMLR
jgi:hypothetical protein